MTLYTSLNRILIMLDNKNFAPKVYFKSKFDLRLIRGKNQGFFSLSLKASFWGLLGLIPGNLIFPELKFFRTY